MNPNRPDCTYPNKGLCGAGIAFKLCEALWRAASMPREELLWHLDLVALATVADLVPLTGENLRPKAIHPVYPAFACAATLRTEGLRKGGGRHHFFSGRT